MTRLVAVALALTVALSACGLGDREAQADRVIRAGEKLLATPSIAATVEATVTLVASDKPIAPGPPKFAPEHVNQIGAVINPRQNSAALGTNSANGKNVIVFAGNRIYQRITLKSAGAAKNPLTAAVPSNFNALAAAMTNQLVAVPAAPGITVPVEITTTTSTSTTTTTAPPSKLRRRLQITREWAVFDYAAIKDRDRTKHGGSLAINPVDLLRLSRGVLAGSIKRRGTDASGRVEYDANVSRDKAERKLSEDERDVVTKEFVANAITRRVFPAKFWLDADGSLARMQVKLRQQLSNIDRADLTVTFDFALQPTAVVIKAPGKQGTVHVRTLGELVTTVTGQ
jgi:hypothetical protein